MSNISKNLGIYSKDQTNLRTHGVEGGPETNSKGTVKLFNEIIAQNFLNLEAEIGVQIQEAHRTPNSHGQRLLYDISQDIKKDLLTPSMISGSDSHKSG